MSVAARLDEGAELEIRNPKSERNPNKQTWEKRNAGWQENSVAGRFVRQKELGQKNREGEISAQLASELGYCSAGLATRAG
jgi:hypothetical protein